jgi:hypothetical protein
MTAINALALSLGYALMAGIAIAVGMILVFTMGAAARRVKRERDRQKRLTALMASMTPEREIGLLSSVTTYRGHTFSWERAGPVFSKAFVENEDYFLMNGYVQTLTGVYGAPVLGQQLTKAGRECLATLVREHPELRHLVKDRHLLPAETEPGPAR